MSNDTLGDAADQPLLHSATPVRTHDDQIDVMGLSVVANRPCRGVVGEHRDLYVDVREVLIAERFERRPVRGFIGFGGVA